MLKRRGKKQRRVVRTGGRCARRRRWWLFLPVWLLAVLLLAEGGIRLAGLLLRRDEGILPRPAGSASVIYCIGDSFTYGAGVEPEQAYPKVLEKLLCEAGEGVAVSVENLGWPGLASSNAVYAVARTIEKGDAALVLVLAGWNANNTDFLRLAEEKNEPVPLKSRIDTVCDHSRLYRLTKQVLTYRNRTAVLSGIKMVPQAPGMDQYDFVAYQQIARKNLRAIARLCHEFDTPLVLLAYPYQDLPANPYSKNEYYHVLYGRTPISPEDYIVADRRPDEIAIHAVIREVGRAEGVPVIDLHAAFLRSGRSDLFQADWHHPTAAGHEIMARVVLETIRPHLEDPSTRLASAP